MNTRLNRKDRMILEALEDKYGTNALATAIIELDDDVNGFTEQECKSPSLAVLEFIQYLEGIRIRLREIHWMTERNATHKLTDDMIADIEEFEDNLAEDLMGVCGFRIKVGMVVPKMTNQVELSPLLDEFHEEVVQLCASIENDDIFGGIVNELDDMKHSIAKWKYLAKFK